MIYGIFAIVIGLTAILVGKFVLPKLQAKMEEQTRIQNEKKSSKKSGKRKGQVTSILPF